MSKNDIFVQCDLQRDNGQIDVSWIPERYVQIGRSLKLKDDNGCWESGWRVVATYARRHFAEIEMKERDYKHQREASDV